MPIFSSGAATQTTASVTNSATQVFNSSASGIPTGATIGDVTVINTGSTTFFVGPSGVTATTGLRVPAGAQVTINGFGAVQGNSNYNIYAITASGTSSAIAGPVTLSVNE